jgi:hypothetical protein
LASSSLTGWDVVSATANTRAPEVSEKIPAFRAEVNLLKTKLKTKIVAVNLLMILVTQELRQTFL